MADTNRTYPWRRNLPQRNMEVDIPVQCPRCRHWNWVYIDSMAGSGDGSETEDIKVVEADGYCRSYPALSCFSPTRFCPATSRFADVQVGQRDDYCNTRGIVSLLGGIHSLDFLARIWRRKAADQLYLPIIYSFAPAQWSWNSVSERFPERGITLHS